MRLWLWLALVSPAMGWAQAVSPGPLSESHADLDTGTKCTACHQLAGKTAFAICVECHTHQPLKRSLQAEQSLHGRNRAQPCSTCHFEHKGRDGTVADWSKVGGQTAFDHKMTGFVLKGSHEKTRCTSCHKRATKTGWILFAGLDPDCDHCHKNPHKFTDVALRTRCLECHVTGGVAPKLMKPADVPFDHAEVTGLALVGKHGLARCSQCHQGGKMSMEVTRTCANCHKNPHQGSQAGFVKKNGCASCHPPAKTFKEPTFDHTTTGFTLLGPHGKLACRACHAKTRPAPTADCGSCHKGTHRDRFARFSCAQCHANEEKVVFPHGELTKFKLTSKHAEIRCRACHRGAKPWQWEKFTVAEASQTGNGAFCKSCHRHAKAHNGQFDDKPCLACHLESGGKKLTFDHNKDSKFALTGAHQALADARKCKSCHKDGLYRTGKTGCVDCHKDVHKGTLGAACERCHSPEKKFQKTQFDHSSTAFKLDGQHLEVECEKCHPNRLFKTGKVHCIDCHAATEPHEKRLGADCERCHTTAKGAPRFDHERMTRFARVGRHLEVGCGWCHRPALPSPPKVGWASGTPGKLDLRFPVMGKTCVECHADPHQGANGAQCDSCHRFTAFKDVSVSVHDTGAFRLGGKHASLPCARCHGGGRLLSGTGEACVLCHRDDDPHRNALGPFCGECHQQLDWRPASFTHAQTAFPLLGRHRTTDCRRCHGSGTFQGLPTTCQGCHAAQAAAVADPIHSAELDDCESCHSAMAFRPARFQHPAWTLVANHRRVSCTSCHLRGSYAGTPDTCESCHLNRYFEPCQCGAFTDHRAAGYPTSCADCHTPAGWIPARTP